MPLIIAFWLRVFNGVEYLDVIVPLVIVNGFLLGSLSVVVLASLALRLTGRRDVALASAAVWAFLPYILYAIFGLHRDADLFRDSYVPFMLWANGLSDGPSMFLFLFGLLVALTALEEKNGWLMALAGAMFGFAAVIRIHTAAMFAPLFGLLLLKRDWRRFALLTVGTFAGYLPQFWYSAGTGSALAIPYIQNWFGSGSIYGRGWYLNLKNTPFAPQFLLNNTVGLGLRHPEISLPVLVGAFVALFGFIHLWRRQGWFRASLLFGTPLFVFLFFALTFVFAEDPFRFTVPAFPLGIVAGAYTAIVSVEWAQVRWGWTGAHPAKQHASIIEVRRAPEQR
ncbi:MAG: hypothetical protein HY260_15410 [Chloroflexi bacterium]|nr:hypothetical protein [Chloroflexota bacterium]